MPHEWIGPKRRKKNQKEQPTKSSFKQISSKELLELYRTIGFDPKAEHKHQGPPQTVITHNLLEEKPKDGTKDVKIEPKLVENRPRVKTVVRDVLTGSRIS